MSTHPKAWTPDARVRWAVLEELVNSGYDAQKLEAVLWVDREFFLEDLAKTLELRGLELQQRYEGAAYELKVMAKKLAEEREKRQKK